MEWLVPILVICATFYGGNIFGTRVFLTAFNKALKDNADGDDTGLTDIIVAAKKMK